MVGCMLGRWKNVWIDLWVYVSKWMDKNFFKHYPRGVLLITSPSLLTSCLQLQFWSFLIHLLTKTAWLGLTWAHTTRQVTQEAVDLPWGGGGSSKRLCAGVELSYSLGEGKSMQLNNRRAFEVNQSCKNRMELNLTWAMNHAVSLPCNHITEPATVVSGPIYIVINICI